MCVQLFISPPIGPVLSFDLFPDRILCHQPKSFSSITINMISTLFSFSFHLFYFLFLFFLLFFFTGSKYLLGRHTLVRPALLIVSYFVQLTRMLQNHPRRFLILNTSPQAHPHPQSPPPPSPISLHSSHLLPRRPSRYSHLILQLHIHYLTLTASHSPYHALPIFYLSFSIIFAVSRFLS